MRWLICNNSISKVKIPAISKTPGAHSSSCYTPFQLVRKESLKWGSAANSLKRLGRAPLRKTVQQSLLPEVQVKSTELFIVLLLVENSAPSFIISSSRCSATKNRVRGSRWYVNCRYSVTIYQIFKISKMNVPAQYNRQVIRKWMKYRKISHK